MRISTATAALIVGTFVPGLVPSASAQGQTAADFPRKPINLVIGFVPGGVVDVAGRLIAQRLSEAFKQPVIAENRGGAGGNIAASFVARAPADGHTLLFTAYTTLPISRGLGAKLDFDPLKDITPVALIGANTNLLVVRADLPAKSVQELVALARAKPGTLTFGTIGNASSFHLASEQLRAMANADWLNVHFKGGGPAMTELIAGRIDFMFATLSLATPNIKSGRIRALALANGERSAYAPELPTIAESGFPGYNITGGLAMFAPGATPSAVLDRLAAEVQRAGRDPGLAERLAAEGVQASRLTRQQFAEQLVREAEQWGRIARENNIKLD
jgi:tripartite-type tricarboxylate transporter receptor subunit TctC